MIFWNFEKAKVRSVGLAWYHHVDAMATMMAIAASVIIMANVLRVCGIKFVHQLPDILIVWNQKIKSKRGNISFLSIIVA